MGSIIIFQPPKNKIKYSTFIEKIIFRQCILPATYPLDTPPNTGLPFWPIESAQKDTQANMFL